MSPNLLQKLLSHVLFCLWNLEGWGTRSVQVTAIIGAVGVFTLLAPATAAAQTVHQEFQEVVRAQVHIIVDERERRITGTDATATVQEVQARLLSGTQKGRVVTFENDLVRLEPGDRIFLNHLEAADGTQYFVFKDMDRRAPLALLALLFVAVVAAFAGTQGLRALASLLISIGLILFVLVPLLLHGHNPVLISIMVSAVILAVVLFGTHGVTARAAIAFFGTLSAVVVTGAIATVWVSMSALTGFGSDVSVFLNFNTAGTLDFAGLLLGSIIIGMLGVLDDVSITQVSVVCELKRANRALSFFELYRRAVRVGKDHVGSLVNTLALAYVGVSLPLVLLLAGVPTDVSFSLNQELVAAELVRIMVSSIGLVLAVPLTTLAAAWWFGARGAALGKSDGHTHHHFH